MAGPVQARAAAKALHAEVDRLVASRYRPPPTMDNGGTPIIDEEPRSMPATVKSETSKPSYQTGWPPQGARTLTTDRSFAPKKTEAAAVASESDAEVATATEPDVPATAVPPKRFNRWLVPLGLTIVVLVIVLIIGLWGLRIPRLITVAPLMAQIVKTSANDPMAPATALKPPITFMLAEIDTLEHLQLNGAGSSTLLSEVAPSRQIDAVAEHDRDNRASGHLWVDVTDLDAPRITMTDLGLIGSI